jgi:alternate signal-mediated exported protein
MNKFTKASIATGAGIVLLLGGGGTLAYWNAEAASGAGTINAGTLALTPGAAGAWADENGPINPSTFLVVPGDTLTFTRTFTISATGNNLVADLDIDDTGVLSEDWDDELTASAVFSTDDGAGNVTSGVTQVTDANNGDTLTVVVTLAFAFDGDVTTADPEIEVNNDSQGDSVDLTALKVVLTQVQP